ncbi:MAG: ferrous iron transport protein B [Firmicutes bacterium]|nr:ferrous iron transport protein B [Bacillota bacterium]MBR0104039.1 ferrous iron transport protein B [Bacillota bacterium]MBR2594378.1 ferrous iron transport protein B [Bacillota bacterium]
MVFALAGNQNSGKTTLFNQLTGSNQHVGNFPGVTVERKDGTIKGYKNITLVDLPGIYSLSPFSKEEVVSRDFIIDQKPSAIINIVDATNVERSLFLTLQLIELNIPMVIALNMMDEMRESGSTVDIKRMEEGLGVPVIPISASKNEGVAELLEVAVRTAKTRQNPKVTDFCSGPVHRTVHSIRHIIEDHAERIGIPDKFAATKIAEGDDILMDRLELSQNEKELIEHDVQEMETEMNMDREAAMADMRYTFIDNLCAETVKKSGYSKAHSRSLKIDGLLTHKTWAIPIFIGIMLFVFWLTFGIVGTTASDAFSGVIDSLIGVVDANLTNYGINEVVHSLVIDGVFAGIGSVLSFLPIIVILFFCLSMLEDSGYMARVAFVMDKPLRKIGLSGRSFVPMLIGFGCTVPAVMATRTLTSERDKKMTILMTPFMSCSAKLPVYGMLTGIFFGSSAVKVIIVLYVIGIGLALLCGFIMNRSVLKGNPVPFVMELPNYRMPTGKNTGMLLWDKARDFLTRAFTVIFLGTIIIWFFRTFDLHMNVAATADISMLAYFGRLIAPAFRPMGFGNWMSTTALITGFAAKEAIISTLTVLVGGTGKTVTEAVAGLFTQRSAWAYLVFILVYTPCIAAVSAIRRELGSSVQTIGVVIFQCAVAWVASLIVYGIVGLIL